jgi:O-antigen ligase
MSARSIRSTASALSGSRLGPPAPALGGPRSVAPRRISGTLATILGLTFLALHVPLGLAMRSWPSLSTLHALATVAVGLLWALSGHPRRVACVGAYLVGSEVLWRMTGASFFWEGAKYGTVFIFAVALLRSGRLRAPGAMVAYFLLLLPSTALVWLELGASEARSVTSFNLSGPLALAVSVWFFSHLKVSREGMSEILFALVAPAVGVLALSFFGVVTTDIVFGGGSNFASSGGFGPNQVSAILGLAALAAFMLALDHARPLLYRGAMLVLLLAFAGQSALTFSRTGVVALVLCIGIGVVFLVKSPRDRVRLAIGLPLVLAAAVFVVVPRLESMTGGAVGDRFSDTSPTGRDQLAKADWLIFLDHPILGVGPGQAKALRGIAGRVGMSHTEYTRLMAEHGILGIFEMALLFFTALKRLKAAKGASERAIVSMLYAWSALFMLVSGMRLVAPSFAFGLASAAPPRRASRRRTLSRTAVHRVPRQAATAATAAAGISAAPR